MFALPAKDLTVLLADVRELIVQSREGVARAVDAGLTTLYWHVGQRIRQDILKGKRAEYGERIVSALSAQLEREFGRGFGRRNLFRMVRFTEVFPDPKIVSALRTQLGWTHFRAIIALDDPLKRDFYAEMCRLERWSTRTLEKKIGSLLFERTALSRKPAKLAELELKELRTEDKLTPDLIFRDPYILDFLGLKDAYAEKDLEAAILREMEGPSRRATSTWPATGRTCFQRRNWSANSTRRSGWRGRGWKWQKTEHAQTKATLLLTSESPLPWGRTAFGPLRRQVVARDGHDSRRGASRSAPNLGNAARWKSPRTEKHCPWLPAWVYTFE
jgi:hypothetical protein